MCDKAFQKLGFKRQKGVSKRMNLYINTLSVMSFIKALKRLFRIITSFVKALYWLYLRYQTLMKGVIMPLKEVRIYRCYSAL